MFGLTVHMQASGSIQFDNRSTTTLRVVEGSKRFRMEGALSTTVNRVMTYTHDHYVDDFRVGDIVLLCQNAEHSVIVIYINKVQAQATKSWVRDNARDLLNNLMNV
jgi:hypothetical protein